MEQINDFILKMRNKEYCYPSVDLLDEKGTDNTYNEELALKTGEQLISALSEKNIKAEIHKIRHGISVTRFEVQFSDSFGLRSISRLADYIEEKLGKSPVRIDEPLYTSNIVGIEIPVFDKKEFSFRQIVESEAFKTADTPLPFAIGINTDGEPVIYDLQKAQHIIVAGDNGETVSACLDTFIAGILFKSTPEQVQMMIFDPDADDKKLLNNIPHLMDDVITSPEKACEMLEMMVNETTNRLDMFDSIDGVNNLDEYNKIADEKLPQIVIIINRLALLMQTADSKQAEDCIYRLAQLAGSAGIHLVISARNPAVEVITGLIKANIPSRIAFRVSDWRTSHNILDGVGAEKLLGDSDMLFRAENMMKARRIQGAFVTGSELEKIIGSVEN